MTVSSDVRLDTDSVLDLLLETNDEFMAATGYCLASAAYARKLADNALFVVAHNEGSIAGVIAYYYNEPQHQIYISYLTVKQKFARKGIGRAMLNALSDAGRKRNYHTAVVRTLQTNQAAIALYHAAGYVIKEIQGRKYLLETSL